LVGVPAAVFLFVRFWDRLLEWEGGRAWPVPAALAPPCIAIVRGWDSTGPFGPIGPTMTAVLLGCIALLQIYGQARAERYRKLADAEIRRISSGVSRIAFGIDDLAAYLASEKQSRGEGAG